MDPGQPSVAMETPADSDFRRTPEPGSSASQPGSAVPYKLRTPHSRRFIKPSQKARDSLDGSEEPKKSLKLNLKIHPQTSPQPVSSETSAVSRSPPPKPIKLLIDYGAWEIPFLPKSLKAVERVEQYQELEKKSKPNWKYHLVLRNDTMLLCNREWRISGKVKRNMDWPSKQLASGTRTLWMEFSLPGRSHGGFLEYFLEWDQARREEERIDRSKVARPYSETNSGKLMREIMARKPRANSGQSLVDACQSDFLDSGTSANPGIAYSPRPKHALGVDGTTDDANNDVIKEGEETSRGPSHSAKRSQKKAKGTQASARNQRKADDPAPEANSPSRPAQRLILKLNRKKTMEETAGEATQHSIDAQSFGSVPPAQSEASASMVDTPMVDLIADDSSMLKSPADKATPARTSVERPSPSKFEVAPLPKRSSPMVRTLDTMEGLTIDSAEASMKAMAPVIPYKQSVGDLVETFTPKETPSKPALGVQQTPASVPSAAWGPRSLASLTDQYDLTEVCGHTVPSLLDRKKTEKPSARHAVPATSTKAPPPPKEPMRGPWVPVDDEYLKDWEVSPGVTDAQGVLYENGVYTMRSAFPPAPILTPSFLHQLSELPAQGFTNLKAFYIELDGWSLKNVDDAFMRLLERWLQWLAKGVEEALVKGGLKPSKVPREGFTVKMLGVPVIIGREEPPTPPEITQMKAERGLGSE